ncbi:SCO family protein [Hyphobacterium sp. HN65]|uniref:SCO family protein n=1 Tax=Hyphobacterium lacteum TaxID=3116575 RepID=A0ABU7LTM7_9PROT|nr:SCO family protein [Hyphobacterium sp. HN65]MEE2527283.1 SCO family protein [Hyphobacterium sp. HN65]
MNRGSGLPIWVIPLAAGIGALVLVFAILMVMDARPQPVSGEVVSTGRADIGGPFTLVDQTGATVTEADFLGRPMLIYFGFTYCPDICPFSLQVMAAALDQLPEDERAEFQPILITVDPERDTPEQLALYVTSDAFPDNLTGLTGTPEQIAAAAAEYRVIYRRALEEGAPEDAYTMDHTSLIYLMDRQGEFHSVYAHGTPPDVLAEGLQDFLEENPG